MSVSSSSFVQTDKSCVSPRSKQKPRQKPKQKEKMIKCLQQGLVAISPLEVLGSDVLVRVFGALLQGGHVAPVLPVVLPQDPGVGASSNQEDRNTAKMPQLACVFRFFSSSLIRPQFAWQACSSAPCAKPSRRGVEKGTATSTPWTFFRQPLIPSPPFFLL